MATLSQRNETFWGTASLVLFYIGLAAWAVFFLGLGQSAWMLSLLTGPLGLIFGIVGLLRKNPRAKFGTIANAIMSVSFFLYMFFGYLIESLFA